MPRFTDVYLVNSVRRTAFWFVSLLIAVLLFSFILGMAFGSVSGVFRITMMFAAPVWCLYLPFIFLVENANGRRGWILLSGGILIGPAALMVWGLVHLVLSQNIFQGFWSGDPEERMGLGFIMIFAATVGLLTSTIYVLFLKFTRSRSTLR